MKRYLYKDFERIFYSIKKLSILNSSKLPRGGILITLNNYQNNENGEEELKRAMDTVSAISYIYVDYKNTLSVINIDVDIVKGNKKENINYCSKDGDYTKFGEKTVGKTRPQQYMDKKRKERKALKEEESREKMKLFLKTIQTKTIDEIEALYHKEFFNHTQKIKSYKVLHQNLNEI